MRPPMSLVIRLLLIGALLLPVLAEAAADFGINFRATASPSPFAGDAASETYCVGSADAYPVPARNGIVFGYETSSVDMGRDRGDGTTDRRLFGMNQTTNDGASQVTFRIDLPNTGIYRIHLAMGDISFAQGYQYLELQDGTTTFATIDDTNGTSSNNFDDATGTNYSTANWPASETYVERTFASTILRVKFGTTSAQSGSSTLAHVRVEEVGGSTPVRRGTLSLLGVGQ